ncbi:hypothetical protein C3941_19480 [Kaistia algarum]|uniref:hypothetical protein n=1 Tax=Kaistia algarum TaxID=2083279 RepID=UPI000CE809E9|nr:hypothetical protein [Kaistia algarum]MCX5516174.1 hypothetical protein [Kaistia algarum]PPE78249.1 hypothetical protein C3941_19480 [Kaistia algarum]
MFPCPCCGASDSRAIGPDSRIAELEARVEKAEAEYAEICKELGCVQKPGVAIKFIRNLRIELQHTYARNVEIMRLWDNASPTELQELDRLRRGWGPSTPTERQARHHDLIECMQAFLIALSDLSLPEEVEVSEEAQKAFDAAYDRVQGGYVAVIALIQKMHEPIAKPDIDWEARAIAAEAELSRLRAALIEAGREAGAGLSDSVSTDFLMGVPNEIKLVLSRLRATDTIWRDNVQAHAAAMRMVRDAIGEMFGPLASLESEEAVLLRGPEPHHDAEAIIAALSRLRAAGTQPDDLEQWATAPEDDATRRLVARAIAKNAFGRDWDDFETVNASDVDKADLISYAAAAIGALRSLFRPALTPTSRETEG